MARQSSGRASETQSILNEFDSEFGSSDTQSNYTRLYSWMANQLGHMALGLIVALFCYWSRETILTFFDVFALPPARPDAPQALFFRDFDAFELADAALLSFSMITGIVLFLIALVVAADKFRDVRQRALGHDVSYAELLVRVGAYKRRDAAGNEIERKRSLGARVVNNWHFYALAAVALCAGVVGLRDSVIGPALHAGGDIGWYIAHLYAPAMLLAALFGVARKKRYIVLGGIMIATATILWMGYADPNGPLGAYAPWVIVSLFAAFVLLTGWGCDCSKDFPEPLGRGYATQGADLAEGDDSNAAVFIGAFAAAIITALGAIWIREIDVVGHALTAVGLDMRFGFGTLQALIYSLSAYALFWALVIWAFQPSSPSRLQVSRLPSRTLRDREFFTIFSVTAFFCSLVMLLIIANDGLSPDTRTVITDLPAELDDKVAQSIEAFRGWRTGLAVFFMSIALWWIKEFGNDLSLAEVELRDAERLRLLNTHPPGSNKYPEGIDLNKDVFVDDFAPGTGGRRYTRLERQYLRDAKWDSRTDAFFYVSGAWIAAGVVTDDPVLTDAAWSVGSELIGLLLFVGFFLWRGRIWAARQQAIDAAKVPRSRRLVTLQSAVKIFTYVPTEMREDALYQCKPIPEAKQIMPLNWLYVFAADRARASDEFRSRLATDSLRDTTDDVRAVDTVEHLVVVGRYGSSRTLLGVALACDATLAPLELGRLWQRKTKKRQARYGTLAQIAKHARLEMAFAPNIAFDPEEADFLVLDDADCPDFSSSTWQTETVRARRAVYDALRRTRPEPREDARRQKFVWILNLDPITEELLDPQQPNIEFQTVADAVDNQDPLEIAAMNWINFVLVPALQEEQQALGRDPKWPNVHHSQIAVALISRVTENEWIYNSLKAAEAADLHRTSAEKKQRRKAVSDLAEE